MIVKILLLERMAGGKDALGGGPGGDPLGEILREHVSDGFIEVPTHPLGGRIGSLIKCGQPGQQGVAVVLLEPGRQVGAPG